MANILQRMQRSLSSTPTKELFEEMAKPIAHPMQLLREDANGCYYRVEGDSKEYYINRTTLVVTIEQHRLAQQVKAGHKLTVDERAFAVAMGEKLKADGLTGE